MKKIRILEMIDQPFLGGGQMALLALARSLDRERFEVFVCSREGGPFIRALEKNRIHFYPISFSRRFRQTPVKEIASLLDRQKIDILHTHGGVAGLYGRWASRRSRTPVVIHTLHGIHYLHYRNVVRKWALIFLERHFSRFTDGIIVVSEADLRSGKKFKLAPEDKMHLIKNGVDFSPPTEAGGSEGREEEWKRKLKTARDHPVVGTVARLHRQKGIIYFLRAASIIHRRIPEAQILVAGGGPLEQKLRQEAKRLGVQRYFLLLGERTDARELLSYFDVFALPSLWEGLPLALLEAAALGKPIVATDIDGVREVIKDGETGILVPPKNPEILAHAIVRLLEDRQQARNLGQKAKELIPPRFDLVRMVEQTQSLYLDLYRQKLSF
ncbi:MAG: glycosyltransferase [Candidatus Aminicenantales bacterium]